MEPTGQLTTQPQTTETNALAIYQKLNEPMAAIKEMGQMFASSGMFGCSKLEQGQVLALACLIEGKSPFELMRNYHIIGGTLSMKSVAVLAEFLKRGGQCKWLSTLNNVDEAKADFAMGENSLVGATYTIEDAKREGLIAGPNKHNWSARPADMLRARLITKAVRMIAPGIIMGLTDDAEALVTREPTAALLPAKTVTATVEPIKTEPTLEDALLTYGVSKDAAVEFLVTREQLKEGETLKDLTKASRGRIMKHLDEFVDRVKEYANTEHAST